MSLHIRYTTNTVGPVETLHVNNNLYCSQCSEPAVPPSTAHEHRTEYVAYVARMLLRKIQLYVAAPASGLRCSIYRYRSS